MQNFKQQSERLVHFLILNALESESHVHQAYQTGDSWKIQRKQYANWEDIHPAVIEHVMSQLIDKAANA